MRWSRSAGPARCTPAASPAPIGIRTVIVPFAAGVGSAVGLLVADHKVDAGTTRMVRLDGNARPAIAATLADLERRARAGRRPSSRWARTSHSPAAPTCATPARATTSASRLPAGDVDAGYEERMREAFHDAYRREYGFVDRDATVEVTDWYVVATVAAARSRPDRRRRRGIRRRRRHRRARRLFPRARRHDAEQGHRSLPHDGRTTRSRGRAWSRSGNGPPSSFPATSSGSTGWVTW